MKYKLLASLMPMLLSMPILAQDDPKPKEKEIKSLPLLQSPHFYLGGRLGATFKMRVTATQKPVMTIPLVVMSMQVTNLMIGLR